MTYQMEACTKTKWDRSMALHTGLVFRTLNSAYPSFTFLRNITSIRYCMKNVSFNSHINDISEHFAHLHIEDIHKHAICNSRPDPSSSEDSSRKLLRYNKSSTVELNKYAL